MRSRTAAAAIAAFALTTTAAAQQVSSNWYRNPAISPDGRTVVFTHAGDLYSVPVGGGRAIPLTLTDAHEDFPVWSPDGETLAFASDRAGSMDIYTMQAAGGDATRLTYHSAADVPTDFAPDGSAVLFQSARLDHVNSVYFPSGVLNEVYLVPLTGGTPEQVLTNAAVNARYSADGTQIIYEDRKGYEDPLRKHHTSSIARDIWVYDIATREHTQLTTHENEDRNPHLTSDGDVYFLSERDGDSNIYRMDPEPDAPARRLTEFEHHPVRELSISDNGRLAFSWHGDIYTMRGRGRPDLIEIELAIDTGAGTMQTENETRGANDFAVSPNGKEIAFTLRGDIFVTSVDFGTTRRITATPEQERTPSFHPEGRRLAYAGERDGSWNIYEASLTDDDELYFFSATAIEEEPLVATEFEEFQPGYSPDGEKLAYVYRRDAVNVLDLESGRSVTALGADEFYSYADGDHWYHWAPDSNWLAVHYYDASLGFYADVGLVKADGSGELVNLSLSGYDDSTPRFSMNGNAIVWSSGRFGERSHGSWGGERDVLGVFLNQDAWDRFRLSKEEYELQKELDEKTEEDEEGESDEDSDGEEGDDDGDSSDEDQEDKADPIELDIDGLDIRRSRMTIHSSSLGDFYLTNDGDKLFYLAAFEGGQDLWLRDFREGSTKILAKLGGGGASFQMSPDESAIFLLSGGGLAKVDPSTGERKPISFSAEIDADHHAERAYFLDHVWRQTKKKFYDPGMHGVDWAFYREQYEPKLGGVHTDRDFAEVLSEMLGELNASHTGGFYRGGGDSNTATAALGVFFDDSYNGPGFRIAEIMHNSPLDRAELDVEVGDVIFAIDGVELGEGVNYFHQLENKSGKRTRLTIRRGRDDTDVVVKPISLGAENQLRYERWITTRRDLVEELSGGRLGYAHVRGMNDASFRAFYQDVMGRHYDKEAIIVDTRFNGGGWLHDDLVTFLTGTQYVTIYPRSDASPTTSYVGDSAKRWNKPSIVVMSESNYSDAHFFPWAYTEVGAGETVGMPVPGTATAVWWETLHTGTITFGIPQVGTKGAAGTYLENDQLEPTHKVALPPEAASTGRDTQIEAAVRVLLNQLDS
ncbi:MAG: S41 family peptidase [Planctomycetota bacterium]